ncbi:MAG: unnamed protein product [uncultured Paraburkholderia sp.]|nr:MAG: unnamed protein product [uncultured Paraburkholderia sp.]CAH2933022.1 MAG: unnamed protein product [uncultured Paraburkholderia sp.]
MRIFVRELSDQFADATIRPHSHTRRIQISLAYTDGRKLDPSRTMVEGNPDGMKMFGMSADAEVSWSTARRGLAGTVKWPGNLEKKIDDFAAGALPPSLLPFVPDDDKKTIYLPVVTKSEALQAQMRRITLVFVEGNSKELRKLLDWIMPDAMPGQLATFLQLVRVLMHVRFDLLEPVCQEIRYGMPSVGRRIEICELVLAGYLCAREDTRKAGISSSATFDALFDKAIRPQLDAAGKEYIELTK